VRLPFFFVLDVMACAPSIFFVALKKDSQKPSMGFVFVPLEGKSWDAKQKKTVEKRSIKSNYTSKLE